MKGEQLMSKYASGLSTDEICKLEMSECEKDFRCI